MSRLKASTFSQPLCGIPEDSTARRASHVGARLPRFSARLNARACRGRGRASELVVEVGSPSSTRIELSAWRPLRRWLTFSRTWPVSRSRDDFGFPRHGRRVLELQGETPALP